MYTKMPYVKYIKKIPKEIPKEKIDCIIEEGWTSDEIINYFKNSKTCTFKHTKDTPAFPDQKKRKATIAYLGCKGYTIKEICEELNETHNAVYMILFKNNLIYTRDQMGAKKSSQMGVIKNIKLLIRKGKTKVEIAKELGYSYSYISGLINHCELDKNNGL